MATFSFYWTVSDVSVSRDFRTRRNVKKHVLFPRYQGSVGDLEAVCAYVGSKEINPASNLRVINSEDSIPENSKAAFNGESKWQGTTWYSSGKYVLVTDVIGDYASRTSVPFYWKHVLPVASTEPDSVVILDQNLNEVPDYSYRVVRINQYDSSDTIISGSYEECSIYSNYKNSYSPITEEYTVFFVRYEVGTTTHYQLLNPQPAFTEATLDDISSVTNQLKHWRKVYVISPGVSLYTITTPQSNVDYYLKPLEKSRIVIREPVDRSDESPWFLNISNGSFSALRDSVSFSYSIPEFASQSFSPLYPYKAEVEEVATYLRPDLIKVGRGSLQVATSFYVMDILIRDAQGNLLYALTTESSRNGDFYYDGSSRVYREVETDNAWITWDSNGIAGWDAEDGFIHLQRNYPDYYQFYVSYYYEETGYEAVSLNVNPVFDESYNGQFYVLYVVPTGGDNNNVSTQTSSVHYIKVNRSGRVIETSQDGTSGNFNLSNVIQTDGEYINYSSSYSTTVNGYHPAGSSILSVNLTTEGASIPGHGVLFLGSGVNTDGSFSAGYSSYVEVDDLVKFTLSSTLSSAVSNGSTVSIFSFRDLLSSNGSNNLQWLILAEVHISTTSKVEDLSVIDLRKEGGVLKEKYMDEAIKLDPRAIWAKPEVIASRGQPIPGDSVAIVKVPYTLLTEYGGQFSQQDVEDIVYSNHLASGIVPVIIFHGAIPEISSLTSTSTAVTVCWDSEGSDYTYNIYYSSMPNGPWTLANSTPFTDMVYGNCYTISGLTSGLTYYVSVTSVRTDSIESPRGTAWGIRTRT